MHGREGHEHRKLSRHMWSVPSTTTTTIKGVVDSNGCSDSCFIKDGRKINIGDCALFKPAKDSPPFVGIIRCFTSEKESNLRLRVNWLYRPSEVKLLKGVVLEAAPNEVFYSFHSDEIPAASLLHPCKVAFLPKGVELPPGISSFVCRRVYDITNKCLWWLTDQDYIDDRQDEVDKLLQKTRTEMHASLDHQQDSRSPKPVNGSAASPLKHSPDSVQNSSSNLPSHRKGKKRDRVDQSFDVSKRERSAKLDDVDSGQSNSESTSNFEIAKLSEKGGLVDSESVSRLVRLMQPEKSEKKIDLTARCMLAGVIAATDKFDCLNQFVQLRGILILNEWLQEVHKGKINDSGNVKNSDKSVDDFLLVLLRALDKLPVNLNALQMCNIGKSVNHLRSHKNSEIQKKARSLVDTWKKRVEAEMSIGEGERSQHESSHGGGGSSRPHPSGSDAAIRSPITHHSSLKSTSVKHVPGELNSKSTSSQHPVGARSALSPTSTSDHCKDGQSRFAANGQSSEPSQNVAKEEKSSSSSQSHTNSQCSSEQHANKHTIPGGKEDTRRSTAGSKGLNKTVGTTTKHRKSTNGPSSGIHRETVAIKTSSMVKNSSGVEKSTPSSIDASSILENNNQKIIVKIGNRNRGLGQSVGSSLEDSSCRNSEDSSPPLSEKHDQCNKNDPQQILEVDRSSVNQNTSETKRLSNVSKIVSSPLRTESKSRKVHDSAFSSMNALIESCAKISEANVSISAGDDVGMNLLASVAAGEISNAENSSVDLDGQQGQPSEVSKADKTENVDRNVEGGVKNNGMLVEKVDTSMSVSEPGSETVKEKVKPTEESQNEFRVASQKDGGSVKKEFESKAQRENTTGPTNDEEKTSVPQRSDVVSDQSAPVGVQCDPVNTIEKKSLIVSCGTSKPLGSEKSNEVKSEKTDAAIVETCPPEKQVKAEGSLEQKRSCESQHLENKESGDSHSNIETRKSHVVEEESKEKSGPTAEKVVVSPSGGQDVDSKLGFDLNEGFDVDEGKNTDPINLVVGPVSSISCGLPASVTVAAPAKGPFVPPDDLLWNKRELGWKGSAATSAFRPAEPRKSMEVSSGQPNTPLPDAPSRPSRFPLDIDLNVADESCSGPELTTSSSLRGGLDLDLNKVDEASDMAHMGRHMSSNVQRVEIPTHHASSSTSNVFSNSSASGKRDFDLNDGPAIEDLPVEQIPSIQPNRAHIPFQQPPLGPRINTSDIGNCFSWYPPGTSYSLSVTPSALPDREPFSIVGMGGGPQRVMGGPTSALSFNAEAYRGSLLSSSPAMPFHSTPFQYPVLPFGTSFPLPTSALAGGPAGYVDPTTGGRISAIPSQLVGNPTAVSFQYPQAYVVSRSLPDVGNTSVVESSHKWGKQGLDLNSGPGVLEVEGRDESMPTMSRQDPTMGLQSNIEEQARMYNSMGGGNLKRKEPEGGWNMDKFNFKQSSWR